MANGDGIDEALEGAMRLALITAARIGSELAAVRTELLRQERSRDELAARRAQARHEAERRVAVAELSPVYRTDWWDAAGPEQIGKAYQTAVAWAQESPEAAAAVERIQTEVHGRYGIDVPALIRRGEEERAARVEGAVQAAAQERAADPGRALRGFAYAYFDAETDARSSRSYTKEEALEVIAGTPKTITRADVVKHWNGPRLHEWFGVDPDVDRAIADRLPQLIPARYFESETTGSETAGSEAVAGEEAGRRTEPATQASTDRGAAAGGDGARYATVLAEHLGEDGAAAITRAAAWPALVAELHRAEDAGHDVPTLLHEITTGYGRDLDDAQDNAAVLQWRAEHQQPKREPEHARGAAPAAERREQVETGTLAGIAAAEHAANQGLRWDTPERREAEAAALTDNGLDPEIVAVRMRADTATAVPAAEATAGAGPNSTAPKASIDRGVEAAVEVIAER
jgi:hypothetical protein